jgi:hypothetical protein
VTVAGEPTLAEVKEWLKVGDTFDDVTLSAGLQAALAHQQHGLRFPTQLVVCPPETEPTPQAYYPEDLRLAIYLRTARWLARRNSPEGLLGFADFGPAQVPVSDADIRDLESPYRIVTVA